MTEIPEHITIAAKDLCEYCAPTTLAEMVCDWSSNQDTLSLAQIALDAGIRNCGLQELASCITASTDYVMSEEKVTKRWLERGLYISKEDLLT